MMDIAQVDGTSEFPFVTIHSNKLNGAQSTVDLNEAPFRIQEEHLNRLKALSRTGTAFSPTFHAALFNVIRVVIDGWDREILIIFRFEYFNYIYNGFGVDTNINI